MTAPQETPQTPAANDRGPSRLRIFQVFVNAEGLRIRGRRWLRWFTLPSWQRYGFYAVMLVAADAESKPPLLLALARQALIAEFAPISPTPAQSWRTTMMDWRKIGAAPPLIQQPGCIDADWGAAWYRTADDKAKQQRYRLAKLRLWTGQRAKRDRPDTPSPARPSAA